MTGGHGNYGVCNTHLIIMESMQINRLALFSLLWIRRQELQRRIKSYYSTKGAAGVCKRERIRGGVMNTLQQQRYTLDYAAKSILVNSLK